MSQKRRHVIASAIISSHWFHRVWPNAHSVQSLETVKDPIGAGVRSADVEVINDGAGSTRKVTTSSDGVFNALNRYWRLPHPRRRAGFTKYERG
jgi:hypothetical protein